MTRDCPACGSDVADVLSQVHLAPIEGVTALNDYRVVTCRDCGMVYADRIPSQAELDRYYSMTPKYATASEADKGRLNQTAARIAIRVPDRDACILDMGSGCGYLTTALKGHGFTNVKSYDLWPDADFATGGIAYDAVILSGVLEHVREVETFLNSLSSVMRPHGVLYLEVPNVLGFAEYFTTPFQEFSAEHVNFFSVASLRRVLLRSGFTLTLFEWGSVLQTPTQRASNLVALAYKDDQGEDRRAVEAYIDTSLRESAPLVAAIRTLAASQEQVAVWGCGTLLRNWWVEFAKCNIAALTDRNTAYHGKRIGNVPIIPPHEAVALGLPIIVASVGSFAEIRDSIHAKYGEKVDIRPIISG